MIDIKVDARDAIGYLRALSDQTPFATSKAINAVTLHAQSAVRAHVKQVMILRREQFVLSTIKINREDFATKRKLESILRVDPQRDILAKFEAGTTKVPRSKHIAIPLPALKRTKADVIRNRDRPRALLASRAGGKGAVFATEKGIFQRVGTKRAPLVKMLYLFKTSARIRPTLELVSRTQHEVARTWVDEMTRAFVDAQRTAR